MDGVCQRRQERVMIGRYAIVIMTNRLLVVLIVAAEQNNDGIASAHKVPKVPSFILAVSVCLPTAAPPGPAGRISAPDTGWTYRSPTTLDSR